MKKNDYRPSRPTVISEAVEFLKNEKPQIQRFNVELEIDLHEKLKIFCAKNKQNMKNVISMALKDYLERN